LGIILTLGLQALINLGVVTVLLPTKGIALPLMSAGGTGWILTAAALGALVSLDRYAACYASESAPADVPTAMAADMHGSDMAMA
jgi:cell division protein FtsW